MHEFCTEEIVEYKKFLQLTPALFDKLLEFIVSSLLYSCVFLFSFCVKSKISIVYILQNSTFFNDH